MKKNKLLNILILAALFLSSACIGDLDVEPIDPNTSTPNNFFKTEYDYKVALAKIYGSYALSGQQGGGGGDPDIAGIDEGFSNYLRQLFSLQELSSDEVIISWDDATIKNFHWHTWAPNDVFITALYSRLLFTITLANEFIRRADEGMGKGFDDNLKLYREEARFLRTFTYWHAIDMFGNVPFITEEDKPGSTPPDQISRADLFDYLESELLDLDTKLADPGTNEYGRIDKSAAWMLLAKLYQNASVYIEQDRNSDAITWLNKVINEGGYSLMADYSHNFVADNHNSTEIIFPICFDGQNTQQYGGMTFLLHASQGGGMPANGINGGGWGGIRAIKEFPALFGISESDFSIADPEFVAREDKRAMFYFNPSSWQWEIDNVGTFTHGIGVTKFKNVSSTGEDAPNAHPTFGSTDFPAFRLADAYLMYAESFLRGATGATESQALSYVNMLRERAFGNADNNISATELTLDFILDERARELYWECHRRTDLIRFGKFTSGDYLWSWKGNVKAGAATESYRNLYPIPANDLMANPKLVQNPGYN